MPYASKPEPGTGRWWYEHAVAEDPVIFRQLVEHRFKDACVYYPDMRDEGRGYRDCPGVCFNDDVCARLGRSIADIRNG